MATKGSVALIFNRLVRHTRPVDQPVTIAGARLTGTAESGRADRHGRVRVPHHEAGGSERSKSPQVANRRALTTGPGSSVAGLFSADDPDQLEEALVSMPLRRWRRDTVTPSSPRPNGPAPPTR